MVQRTQMVHRTQAKTSALAMVAMAIILQLFSIPTGNVSLSIDAPWWHRLTYHFFHANILHLIVNCWALLCIVFIYNIQSPMLVSAFIIAALYPCESLNFLYPEGMLPTIGLSGICYALLGRYSLSVERKLYYNLWWAFFIGIGFLSPYSNAWLHLYCYLCGVVIAALNKPYKR